MFEALGFAPAAPRLEKDLTFITCSLHVPSTARHIQLSDPTPPSQMVPSLSPLYRRGIEPRDLTVQLLLS